MPSLAGARELAGLLGLGRNLVQGAGLFIGPELFQQGRSGSMLDKSVQNLPGIILDPRTDIGKGAGAALSNELGYIGSQLQRGSLPYLGNEMRYVTNELGAGRIPYTDASKAKPKPKTVKPKVNAPFDRRSPADLAYEAEKSRVAQLTAQDPELKRYADARKLAVAPGATPEQVQSAEDIGMQIWQQKYGNTPLGQPGGAIGRKNPLMEEFFGYQTGMSPQQMQEMQATAAPVPVAPGEIPYQQGDLGTRATLETGYDPAQYGLSPNLVEEMKKRLLQQAGK